MKLNIVKLMFSFRKGLIGIINNFNQLNINYNLYIIYKIELFNSILF